MADTKISGLTADATPTLDDLLVTVNDPGGTPGSRKTTIQNLMDLLEANMSVDLANFTITGSLSEFNSALQGDSFASLTGNETLTNKTIDGDNNTLSNLDIGNEVDWAAATDVSDASAFESGDKLLAFEAGVGMRKIDYDDLPGSSGGDSWGDAVDADIVPDADGTRDLGSTGTRFDQAYMDELHVTEGIVLTEAADHPITPSAGLGQLWISNDATQGFYFTDDGGTDNEVFHNGNSTAYTTSGNTTVIASVSGSFTSGDLVVADANGNLVDGPTPPSGDIVGNTDTQTLTNKTLTAPVLGGTVTGTYTIGGTPTFPGILGDLDTLGAPTTDGEFIVATGAGAFAYETGATARTSMGAAALGANEFTGTQDFNGQQVEGFLNKVVGTVSGTLTTTAHSGNVLETSGNVTVPTTAGFNCVLIAGGAHTVTFNGNTSAAMATGDIMTIIVEDSTTIHAVLTAAADKVSFS